MSNSKLVSIIIDNCNHARFVGAAIDSALGQTYPAVEVIVVDDGSGDGSREVITEYRSRVVAVWKENGGQASAFNAGFARSRGEVVCFLDSDDALAPGAVETVVRNFEEPEVAKVHWPLWVVDERGRATGEVKGSLLAEGDLRAHVLRKGPATALPSAPTSGNAWARWYLESVLPMPEPEFRICADSYLFTLVAAFGRIVRLAEPQGFFRKHGCNSYQRLGFEERLQLGVSGYNQQALALRRILRQKGAEVDATSWCSHAWWPRIDSAINEIQDLVPAGESFILADEDVWGTDPIVRGRKRIPFLEHEGRYWGPPADDDAGLRELERLRGEGASFIVFGWPAFWWLDRYATMHSHLRDRFRCSLETDRLVGFDLRYEHTQ